MACAQARRLSLNSIQATSFGGADPHQHPYLRRLEPALIEGQAAFRAARHLKSRMDGRQMLSLLMLVLAMACF